MIKSDSHSSAFIHTDDLEPPISKKNTDEVALVGRGTEQNFPGKCTTQFKSSGEEQRDLHAYDFHKHEIQAVPLNVKPDN